MAIITIIITNLPLIIMNSNINNDVRSLIIITSSINILPLALIVFGGMQKKKKKTELIPSTIVRILSLYIMFNCFLLTLLVTASNQLATPEMLSCGGYQEGSSYVR